jgi:hypothetical protein
VTPLTSFKVIDRPPSAKAWMVKGWRDLETARRAAGGEPPFYDIAVYHCQQAAEKAVKARPDDLRFRPQPASSGGAAMKRGQPEGMGTERFIVKSRRARRVGSMAAPAAVRRALAANTMACVRFHNNHLWHK